MTATSRTNGSSQLFSCNKRGTPTTRMRLLCFPWAGGHNTFFEGFVPGLAPYIEMYTLKLPGRGLLIEDPAYTDVTTLIDDIAKDVHTCFRDKPFCFLGHSFGAMLAFFVTQKLSEKYGLKPASLFLSSTPAPQSPLRKILREKAELLASDDEALIQFIVDNGANIEDFPDDEEDREDLVFRPLRQDLGLSLQFSSLLDTSSQGPWLSCPIRFYYGDDDMDHDVMAWHNVSSGDFKLTQMKGNHQCILEPKNIEKILKDVKIVLDEVTTKTNTKIMESLPLVKCVPAF